jgi:hypothetical protein
MRKFSIDFVKEAINMLPGATSGDSSNLVQAAGELVRAACLQVDKSSLTIGNDAVQGLRQSIADLKAELVKLNQAAAMHHRDRKLEWALDRVDGYYAQSPEYYGYVTNVLFSFRQGNGHYLEYEKLKAQMASDEEDEEDELERKLGVKFQTFLHCLLGQKPKLVEKNGKMCLFYS